MAFFRKLFGILVFSLTYILMFLQIYTMTQIDDNYDKKGTYLYYFKLFFFASLVVATISHLQASMTDPGKITHRNNVRFLEFYCATRSMAVKNAEAWNTKNMHLLKPHKIDEDLEELCESDCEMDDKEYQESPVFSGEKLNEINKQFGYSFEKCPACNVGRMPNVNHCLHCEGCIYSRDHHCPWLNNCVGLFNFKFFFHFILYSTVSSLISLFISSYYVIYRQSRRIFEFNYFSILISFNFLITIFCLILFLRLLYDQYTNILDATENFSWKKNKMMERRSFSEILYEMFGCEPSFWWIVPFGRGGMYHIYRKKRIS